MEKTKTMLIIASCGFVLSFIIGLCSKVALGWLFLRALFCGIVCIGIYYAFQFVFKTYLQESSQAPSSFSPQKGSNVDISLDDQVLPQDENGPAFRIPKELMQGEELLQQDVLQEGTSSDALSAQNNANQAAVDAPNVNVSSSANAENNEEQKLFSVEKNTEDQDAELGSLPDMDSMLSSIQQPTGEVITNSDFAKAGETASSEALKGADTEIMAKAIHTVLAHAQD